MPEPPKIKVFHEAGQRLALHDLGSHYELMIGHVPILTSKSLGTEYAFGKLVSELGLRKKKPRVLIGGLGFGSTLQGVLDSVGPGAEILLVEKLRTVIDLVRGELAHLAKGALDDPRVTLLYEDVSKVIARERDLDAILLDVDNGPDWGSFPSNAVLYSSEGLAEARRALRVGGSYAVWSGYPSDAFMKTLHRPNLVAKMIPLRERGKVRARAYVGSRA
jgi:spermidine synthase